MTGEVDQNVREFERHLDAALAARLSVQAGGAETLRLAANIVEYAFEEPALGQRLARGLRIIAPSLVSRGSGRAIDAGVVVEDLDFADHYSALRDLLYYTYNAPGAISWAFEGDHVAVTYLDTSIPRQFYIQANNWYLDSMALFGGREKEREDLRYLLRGAPEFEMNPRASAALGIIEREVDQKLNAYFNLVSDPSVRVGAYTFADFVMVFRALLAKALYHRYHSQINRSYGLVDMNLEELVTDLEASVSGLSSDIARSVVVDIAYGPDAARLGHDPVYYSLFHVSDPSESIIMMPHDFAIWEGLVNFMRLVALRDPQTYLTNLADQVGRGLVNRLASAFEGAGFTCLREVPLRRHGPDLPDIDLMVISEERTLGYVILICEVKSPLPPRWAKDQLRVLERDSVAKAFEQLERISAFLGTQAGRAFLRSFVPDDGLPDFDEFAILVRLLVATSDNAGAFFSDRETTVLDFRTLERLLNRCDGDMHYVLEVLGGFHSWTDAHFETPAVDVQVGPLAVSYEGVAVRRLVDFGQARYRSVGAPEMMVREMLEAGDRPLDVLPGRAEGPEK